MNANKHLITKTHKRLECLSWCICAATFAIDIYGILTLPDEIAIHFGVDGLADGYGSSKTLLIVPFFVLAFLFILSAIAHNVKPQKWDISFPLTESNKTKVYQAVLDMLFTMELEFSALFLFIEYEQLHQRGTRILPVTCVFVAVLSVTLAVMSIRAKRINYKFDL